MNELLDPTIAGVRTLLTIGLTTNNLSLGAINVDQENVNLEK